MLIIKDFWSRFAGIYNRVMRKDAAAYRQMSALIRPRIAGRQVLELAAGTGLVAHSVAAVASLYEATDASAEMIAAAKRTAHSCRLHFSVQDMFRLPYADASFDVVIIANALHIIPEPEKALAEAKRVLKGDGLLILPTFTHAEMGWFASCKAGMMQLAGFPLRQSWSPARYLQFLEQNGLTVCNSRVLSASFPLTYAECVKQQGPAAGISIA